MSSSSTSLRHKLLRLIYWMLVSQCYIFHLALCTAEYLDFDEYGNEYKRVTIQSGTSKIYELHLENKQQYIYIVGSDEANFHLIHPDSNATFHSKLDANQRPYFIVESTDKTSPCQSYPCRFNLIISHYSSYSKSIWIRFNRNTIIKPKKVYSGNIDMHKRRKYGMKLEKKHLPVLVKMTPNQRYKKMDIDLYAYHEEKFTEYYFPNRNERNHIRNYPEQLLITAFDNYYHDGYWNFFEIYGSTDSSYNKMNYELQVITNFHPNSVLKKILLAIAFTLAASFVLGVFLSFICTFRHQILYHLRVRSTPHPLGASKRQIRKLTVKKYKNTDISEDEANCVICMDDYSENDDIRILRCDHHFHEKCSNDWLFINKKCPLCNQDIDKAENVHNKVEIEMVAINQSMFDEVPSETASVGA